MQQKEAGAEDEAQKLLDGTGRAKICSGRTPLADTCLRERVAPQARLADPV